MASDDVLVRRLREFLRSSDLTTTTTAIVRRRLEEDFAVDLSDRKVFIREQVDLFLNELEDEKPAEEEQRSEEEERGDGDDSKREESEGDEEEDSEEKSSNGARIRKRESNNHKEVKKRGGGFTKLCSLSPQLQEFVGVPELARTEVVKKLWAYIRENSLQDPSNKKKILCDEKLRNLFKVNSIDMFQMNKALSKHIWPLDSEVGPAKSPLKEKQLKKKREDSDELPRKGKRQKGGSSEKKGFLAPLQLSDALTKFIGTGEDALPRCDVVKKIWDYIKQNNLQDPADKRNIICDDNLKELFEVDSFTCFTVPKLLAAHFIKAKE